MDKELKQLHTIINSAWQILKKHIRNMGTRDSRGKWDTILKECEELSSKGNNEDERELAKDVSMAIYKYLGRVYAHNKKN